LKLSPTQTKGIIVLIIVSAIGIGSSFAVMEYTRVQERLVLATTTSTYDSGLLDEIVPGFEQLWGVEVDIVAVGTGTAIVYGETGNADVIMVHARASEDLFLLEGYGIHRVTVWYNDFVIVGPLDDPAKINGLTNSTLAFERIYAGGEAGNSTFYSRGDNSGTEKKEIAIWALTALGRPDNETQLWYKKTGSGMASTLTTTNNDPKGYTLADRGTYISLAATLAYIEVHTENDTILLNPYGVILVDPGRNPGVNFDLAVKFVAYLCANATQTAVGDYKKNDLTMFYPCYGTSNATGLEFDTDQQVAEYLNYWNPIIEMYY
jgi:tungstate transport system substrate-binding protein